MKCGVVITFHPESRTLAKHLQATLPQVSELIVVDNGSDPETLKNAWAGLEQKSKITPVFNRQNYGLSIALNQGVRKALGKGYDWVLILDQDSEPEPSMVNTMLEAGGKEMAVLGAQKKLFSQKENAKQHNAIRLQPQDVVMNSGSLIPRQCFVKAGFYDETLYLNQIDHDFCLRARKNGFKVYEVKGAILYHQQGAVRKSPLLRFYTFNYSPYRRYVMARDAIHFYKNHYKSSPQFVAADLVRHSKDLLKIVLAEEQKTTKLKAFARGLKDGVREEFKGFDPWFGAKKK